MKKQLLLIIMIFVLGLTIFAQITKFKVNANKCIGCGLCVQTKACPTSSIRMEKGKAVIDAEKCIGCGICQKGNGGSYPGCPTKAFEPYQTEAPKVAPVSEVKPSEVKKSAATPSDEKIKADSAKTTKKTAVKDTVKTENTNVIKKLIYYVDSKLCIGCNLCVAQCPTKAIQNVNGKAVIDAEKCISCGLCKNGNPSNGYQGCPVKAIKTK